MEVGKGKSFTLQKIFNPQSQENIIFEFLNVKLMITNSDQEILNLAGILANTQKRIVFKLKDYGQLISIPYSIICAQGIKENEFFCQIYTESDQQHKLDTDEIFELLKENVKVQLNQPLREIQMSGNYDLNFKIQNIKYEELQKFHESLNDLLLPLQDYQYDEETHSSEDSEVYKQEIKKSKKGNNFAENRSKNLKVQYQEEEEKE